MQLSMFDTGPGFYSVVGELTQGMGGFGWCRWYDSHSDALSSVYRPSHQPGQYICKAVLLETPPLFALELQDAWREAATGTPITALDHRRFGLPDGSRFISQRERAMAYITRSTASYP